VDIVREPEAIHRAGHLDVGKQQCDVGARLENGDRFVGVDGFDRGEACVLDNVHGPHAEDHLIFND
jgi:hypothetical protein